MLVTRQIELTIVHAMLKTSSKNNEHTLEVTVHLILMLHFSQLVKGEAEKLAMVEISKGEGH